jgi:hypothetical protein
MTLQNANFQQTELHHILTNKPFKDEAQTALFKDPGRTAL